MLPRRLLQAALALLAPLAVLTTAIHAQGQTAQTTIVVTVTGIQRTAPRRTDPVSALWISRADCLANDVMTFPLIVTGFTGSLEVWASNGADCRPPEARNSQVSQCWKVFSGGTPNSLTPSVAIRVQDIAAMQKPPMYAQSMGTEKSCTPPAGTASAAQPITLFFMAILGDVNQGGSAWETKLDLVGPPPPTISSDPNAALAVGNTVLFPSWTSTGDIDVAGYDFFCATVDADAAAAKATPVTSFGPGSGDAAPDVATVTTCSDASTSGDATDDASDAGYEASCTTSSAPTTPATSTTTDASTPAVNAVCGSFSAFTSGAPPTADDLAHLCGTVAGALATSTTISGLTNGTTYEVAIGAVDAVGNVGPLSPGVCNSPGPTVGFPENWHAAGGTAGGGFCSMGRSLPAGTGRWWALGSLLAVGMGLGRRRQRQRRVDAGFDRSPA